MNKKDRFVKISEFVPNLIVSLQYATKENITGQVIYPFKEAYLRQGTAEKLLFTQEKLQKTGHQLIIWDAFRPVYAQFLLWQAVPEATFVADPRSGYSNHSKGNTLDVTLADHAGHLLPMPTGFDAITQKANRAYEGISKEAKENALYLEEAMCTAGFTGYFHEWWHYEDTEVYPVEHQFLPAE
ncbi:MAG: M15 family metallopeptidase [Christensenellaceae bacterium]|jgi:D-alanyl-D-alanine dipeptidase